MRQPQVLGPCLALLAGLGSATLTASCTADFGDGPTAPPPRRLSDITLVQAGSARSIFGLGYPAINPDEPFELHWTSDGERGIMNLWVQGARVTGEGAGLSFEVPARCAAHYAARVSGLPSGWYWSITLRYDALPDQSIGPNPCPAVQEYHHDYNASWTIDLSALPLSATDPNTVTVVRLAVP